MKDSRGFLWVGTRDGLSRFDGSRFVTYQVGDRNAPPGIEQILETRNGIYWIVTTGGLYRFDPAAKPNRPTNADRPSLNVEFVSTDRAFLFEDRDGNLWSGGDGLYRQVEKDKKLEAQKIDLNLPPNPAIPFDISHITEGQDRSLWMITSRGLLRRRPDGSETLYILGGQRANPFNDVLEESDGRIWVGSVEAIYVIKPDAAELTQKDDVKVRRVDQLARELPSGNRVNLPENSGEIFKYSAAIGATTGHGKYFCQTTDKHIWISDANRLLEFDGQTFRIHTSAQSLIDESATMIEDAGGNFWLGNSTALLRLHHGGLVSYGANDGLKSSYAITINETHDDKVYLMGADFWLSMFDRNGFQTIRPRLPPGTTSLWTANTGFQDSAGEWWFLTDKKLYRFAATNDLHTLATQSPLAAYDHRDGLRADSIFHIFEDSHQDLWVSTEVVSGLSRWSRATESF